jgi:hypothetical protein
MGKIQMFNAKTGGTYAPVKGKVLLSQVSSIWRNYVTLLTPLDYP